MNVAAFIAQFLVQKGVQHVFGFQGGAILKLLDEMIATGKIRYIQNYHEQASAFAADAYARVTSGIGVALATSGPGATNLITGIANAQLDSIPTLFITGQDYTANVIQANGARSNGFQDLDIVSVVRPITKYAVMLTDPNRVRYEIEKAYWHATNGRPGAVVLDVPIDVQFKEVDVANLEGFTPESEIAWQMDLTAVIAAMQQAKRPLILVGGGVRIARAEKELRLLAERTGIPVISTLNGLDIVEGSFGFAGLHGNVCANLAAQNADLLIACGVRFGQRQVGKKPENYTSATVIHIDIDKNELGRIFPSGIAVQSDLKLFLSQLLDITADHRWSDFAWWRAQIRDWQTRYRSCAYLNTDGLDPVQAVEAFLPYCAQDAILVSDVGQNQMWVAQGFSARGNRKLLNSCGHGSMGYSLPAAIGAKIAHPDRQVIAFTGDGGLHMNIQELMFLGHQRVGVKCVVFNNNTLGMMREVQARYYQSHYYGSNQQEFACANLEKLADAYGLGFARVETLNDIETAASALTDDLPCIIEFAIPYDSKLSNRYDEAEIFERERLM